MIEEVSSVRSFSTLAEAVGFIAECLDTDAGAELLAELEHGRDLLARRPDHAGYFAEFVFGALKLSHEQMDLRERYKGQDFPEDDPHLKLGGHMAELGCTHIDFVRRDDGWRLRDIFVCR
jgi:hypothetical protein